MLASEIIEELNRKNKGIHFIKFGTTLLPLYGVEFIEGNHNDILAVRDNKLITSIMCINIKCISDCGDIVLYEN